MNSPFASIIVMLDASSIAEDELNDWYDTEHIPQREEIDGLVSVKRFVATDGWPRWVCLYDYESADVIHGPAYAAIHAGKGRTAWTARIAKRYSSFIRSELIQVHPGNAKLGEKGDAVRLIVARIANVVAEERELIASLEEYFMDKIDLLQWRLFQDVECSTDYWLSAEFASVGTANLVGFPREAPFGTLALMNIYAPYIRLLK